jgi:hypothetical protein
MRQVFITVHTDGGQRTEQQNLSPLLTSFDVELCDGEQCAWNYVDIFEEEPVDPSLAVPLSPVPDVIPVPEVTPVPVVPDSAPEPAVVPFVPVLPEPGEAGI